MFLDLGEICELRVYATIERGEDMGCVWGFVKEHRGKTGSIIQNTGVFELQPSSSTINRRGSHEYQRSP